MSSSNKHEIVLVNRTNGAKWARQDLIQQIPRQIRERICGLDMIATFIQRILYKGSEFAYFKMLMKGIERKPKVRVHVCDAKFRIKIIGVPKNAR